MRLKADIFVSGLVRLANSRGQMATVLERGRTALGSVIVVGFDVRSGRYCLWAPAPQALLDDAERAYRPTDRVFEQRLVDVGDADITAFVEREKRYDDDIWVVELEIASGDIGEFLDVAASM